MSEWILPTLIAVGFYGLWGFFPKLATNHLDHRSVLIFQSCGVLIATLFVPLLPGFKLQFHGRGIVFAALSGIAGVAGTLFYLLAISKSKAAIVTSTTAVYPAITILLAFIFLKETLTLRQGLGIGLALIGIVLVAL